MSKTHLLIDADWLAFWAASACQQTIWWDDDVASTTADLEAAKEIVMNRVHEIVQASGAADYAVLLCFSCPTRRYFRHDLLESYKGNRKGVPPMGLPRLKEWMKEAYPFMEKPNLEADDVMGILATHPTRLKGYKVIVSPDKDMKQIPGLYLNPLQLHEGVRKVSPVEAEDQLWSQVLTGDATDNYKGCPGIGEKKAADLLKDPEEPWIICRKAYLKAGLGDADLVQQVNVARILTASTYNFKTGKPKLWSLPQT